MSNSQSKFVDYKAVKAAVSMVQILDHYQLTAKLRRSNDSLTGVCPIHNGENATQFRVSISKNCWNCFGKCKRGGNVIDFVSLKEGLGFREAALRIHDWFGLATAEPNSKATSSPPPNAPPKADGHSEAPKAVAPDSEEGESGGEGVNEPLGFALNHLDPTHPYLSERRLSKETVATFGLGFCEKGSMAGRIAIPIENQTGKLVAYAGRWPGEAPTGTAKYRLPKGFRKSIEVYNYHRAAAADPSKPLVVVEGFFDCMRVWQAGYQRVVAIMGSALSEAQKTALVHLTGSAGRILLLLDEDEAGRKGREDALLRLAPHVFVRVISCGAAGMQPDQMTPESLSKLLSLEPLTENPEKIYEGERNQERELIVTVNGSLLDPRLDLRNHSPTGFECGYSGSGAAQLALAILADHLRSDERALECYQDFKWKVVAGLPKSGWTLFTDQIDEALKSLDQTTPQNES
jgi:DNA primase